MSEIINNNSEPQAQIGSHKIRDLVFSPIKSRGALLVVLVVLIVLITLILVNFFSLMKTRQEVKSYLKQTEDMENKLAATVQESKLVSSWRSFGDSFSSLAYIASDKTDMFFDERVTSFSFPPVYEFNPVMGCENADCGIAASDLVLTDKDNSFKPDKIPAELKDNHIIFSRQDDFSSFSINSYIISEGKEERGYVYLYDGRKFTPLITKDTSASIITKYGRGGGTIISGGDDNDFLILYLGYEGKAFHYKNGKLEDISDLFGLRVSDGGFSPYIIKQGKGASSVWYIVSLDSSKPRLIKLWQNNTEKIVGAHDFSYIFNNIEGVITAVKLNSAKYELEFIVKHVAGTGPNAPATILIPGAMSQEEVETPISLAPFELKKFIDKGFNNSSDRSAFSINLNTAQGNITKAKITSIGISGDYKILMANSDQGFFPVKQNEEIEFSTTGRDLFWRLDFAKGTSNEYSPWFNHINYLDYYLKVN
jgi:type II secretory pathway pseudopilin PulG